MKKLIGSLFLMSGYIINAVTILAACAYIAIFTVWMHAPIVDVLKLTALSAMWPLGLAWLCGRTARHLQHATPLFPSSRKRRWLLALGVVLMVGGAAPTALMAFERYQCSSDPAHTATAAARALQFQRDGFERVCTADLARFDIAFGALAGATRQLAFAPVELSSTPFSQLKELGGKAERVSNIPSRLYRGFGTADGHRLTLLEHDMSADGSSSWRSPSDEPERIKGLPARLTVLADAAGASVSILSWIEGRRAYELWIDANVIKSPLRERLFALAASLPPSVPGCPNEVPLKPPRMNADGFPADEALPAVLTRSEMDAIANPNGRRCK